MERAILCLDEGSFRCRADAPYIFAHISSSIKGGEVSALLACLMGFQELTQRSSTRRA